MSRACPGCGRRRGQARYRGRRGCACGVRRDASIGRGSARRAGDGRDDAYAGALAARCEPHADPPVMPGTRDSDDDFLVALARAAQADLLVSVDRDLLEAGWMTSSSFVPKSSSAGWRPRSSRGPTVAQTSRSGPQQSSGLTVLNRLWNWCDCRRFAPNVVIRRHRRRGLSRRRSRVRVPSLPLCGGALSTRIRIAARGPNMLCHALAHSSTSRGPRTANSSCCSRWR